MSVIIEMTVPAEDFVLGRSLEGVESTQFELERMVPTTDAVVPFFWAHNTDPDALETSLEADKDVIDVRMLVELDDRALFRVEWVLDINGLVQSIIGHEAAILPMTLGSFERMDK